MQQEAHMRQQIQMEHMMQKQQALMLAAAIDLALPSADMPALWRTAAEEERREELFGHLNSLYF